MASTLGEHRLWLAKVARRKAKRGFWDGPIMKQVKADDMIEPIVSDDGKDLIMEKTETT